MLTMADTLGKTGNLFSGSLCLSRKRTDLYGARNFVSVRSARSGGFGGKSLVVGNWGGKSRKGSPLRAVSAKMSLTIGKAMQWWSKGIQPNMKEIDSAQDLVDSLIGAGDKLVIVDFFSPGCGGCKALHPKICQLAGMNPDVLFLQVNYEEHKSLCYTLNVHVLPFFRFYRGAHGRLSSFSCTSATIKKFKDALAKHSTERCSLGPAKGLEESELLALAANKDLSFSYTAKPSLNPDEMAEPAGSVPKVLVPQSSRAGNEDKTLVTAGR